MSWMNVPCRGRAPGTMGRTDLSRGAPAPPTRGRATPPRPSRRRAGRPGRRSATPASGSTQRNAPDCPKCPNVLGDASGGVQCGALVPFSSNPRPHGFGRWRPKPGQHPVEVGELRRGGLGEQLRGEHPARVEELAGEAQQVAQRGPGAVGGGAGDRGRGHAERLEDAPPARSPANATPARSATSAPSTSKAGFP